ISGPLQGIYNMTKQGVVTLSETLSSELKLENSKIKVSVLCPGYTNTNIVANSFQNRPAELRDIDMDFETALKMWLKAHPKYKLSTDMFLKAIENGLSPDKAGDIVFEAIKDDAFYILTDTSGFFKRMVKLRMSQILEAFNTNKTYAKQTIDVF
ncbi:MAG TPA: SDR family NAD(P)-dependent oxidoreductase, partial [Candidatus Lokiarchaeia archaeon]